MKGLISIFALPQEIDNLQTTLYNLRRNFVHVRDTDEFGFDITLCLSDELTDWSNSLPKSYFEDRFEEMTNVLCDWGIRQHINIEYGNTILGCVSQRRHSIQYVNEYDFTLWLDNDLMFNDYMLAYMGMATETAKSQTDYYIVTPQITRQWDSTWDVLVNDSLLNEPLRANTTSDVFNITLTSPDEISIKEINTFKFAGGWGTVISNKLLGRVGIPDGLGHYGLEDTYVMQCANMLRSTGVNTKQFVMNNMLVCENHKHKFDNYLSSHISTVYKKEEYLLNAHQNFKSELGNFYRNLIQ